MQTITYYVDAGNTLGTVKDYANAQNLSAPTFTRGVSACLKMRLFAGSNGNDPYPLSELSTIPAWQWIMDDDFDGTSAPVLVADHAEISVHEVHERINETDCVFTEIVIPISKMNTEELYAILGTKESIATLNGELVGFSGTGDEIFVLQVKGFTVRNRISSTGTPTELSESYLNEAQVRALCSAGLEVIFSANDSDIPEDWHEHQAINDSFFRVRLRGDARIWNIGLPKDAGWSDPFGLLIGPNGNPGSDGISYYTYVAYATDTDGANFSMTGSPQHRFIAFLTTSKESVIASDFANRWMEFIISESAQIKISDTGNYFTAETVESALQEIGATLDGLDEALQAL